MTAVRRLAPGIGDTRAVTWQPLPGSSEREPSPLSDALDRLVRNLGGSSISDYRRIVAAWPELVGPAVATHARPASLREGTLVVVVDDPAWATEVRFLERSLLDRLEQLAPGQAPGHIEVRVRPPHTSTPGAC